MEPVGGIWPLQSLIILNAFPFHLDKMPIQIPRFAYNYPMIYTL